jgi:hypothetical protein
MLSGRQEKTTFPTRKNSAESTRKRENQPKHKPYPKKRVNSFPLTTCPTIDSTVQLPLSVDNNSKQFDHFYIKNMPQDADNHGKHQMTN